MVALGFGIPLEMVEVAHWVLRLHRHTRLYSRRGNPSGLVGLASYWVKDCIWHARILGHFSHEKDDHNLEEFAFYWAEVLASCAHILHVIATLINSIPLLGILVKITIPNIMLVWSLILGLPHFILRCIPWLEYGVLMNLEPLEPYL